ncbi:hypothetical protein INT48_008260 [Thamnidium elegans]|uniref:Uncharacterized protein n=1 Tax=Thamnidium elegans TaxID=101142 RepID=A0A8H7VR55_9FUNG|nr:hypothetical protein INT48_008260 [Thamnidium elegans]
MGNSCCSGESASLDDRERRELEAIRFAKEESLRNANPMIQVKPESIKDLSASQIENNIYPAPDYIRAKSTSPEEKPHLNDLKGAKFMNDPNPTPSPMSTPNEHDLYAQIYPPPTPLSVIS